MGAEPLKRKCCKNEVEIVKGQDQLKKKQNEACFYQK